MTSTDDTSFKTQALVDSICHDVSRYLSIGSSFQEKHIEQLTEAITKSPHKRVVTHLEIEASRCSNLSVLLDAVSPTLTTLHIQDGSTTMNEAFLEAILRFLTNTTVLTTLSLHHLAPEQLNSVLDTVCQQQHNTSIRVLDLSQNEIRDCTGVSRLLTTTTCLQGLMLNDNAITDIQPLVASLQHNETLKMLSLADNRIRDLHALSNTLQSSNYTLERMYLHGNVFPHSCVDRKRISYFLQLNHHGRRLLRRREVPVGLYPLLLEKVSDDPCLLYGLLQELPQAWTR